MKTRIYAVSFLMILTFALSGCNRTELTYLQSQNADLIQKNEELQKEIDEIKNGADYRINEIRKFHKSGNDDSVIKLSDELHKLYPDSAQDAESQGYVAEIRAWRVKQAEEERIEKEKSGSRSHKKQTR